MYLFILFIYSFNVFIYLFVYLCVYNYIYITISIFVSMFFYIYMIYISIFVLIPFISINAHDIILPYPTISYRSQPASRVVAARSAPRAPRTSSRAAGHPRSPVPPGDISRPWMGRGVHVHQTFKEKNIGNLTHPQL